MNAKLLLISLFVLSLGFVSCSDDDEPSVDPKTAIVGSWKLSASSVYELETTLGEAEEKALRDSLNADFALDVVEEQDNVMTFATDSTVTISSIEDGKEVLDRGTYSIDGNILVIKWFYEVDGVEYEEEDGVTLEISFKGKNVLNCIFDSSEYLEYEEGLEGVTKFSQKTTFIRQ